MTDKPHRGGLRNPPGGRPPKAPADRKVKINITLSAALHMTITTTYPDEPLSQAIERLLQFAIDTKARST